MRAIRLTRAGIITTTTAIRTITIIMTRMTAI
jgi:hypothetical protein